MKDQIPKDTSKAVLAFKEALESAGELLRFGSEGSKLYLVCFLLYILFYCSSVSAFYRVVLAVAIFTLHRVHFKFVNFL